LESSDPRLVKSSRFLLLPALLQLLLLLLQPPLLPPMTPTMSCARVDIDSLDLGRIRNVGHESTEKKYISKGTHYRVSLCSYSPTDPLAICRLCTLIGGVSVAGFTIVATVGGNAVLLLAATQVTAGIGGGELEVEDVDVESAAVTLAAVVAIFEHIFVLSIDDGEQNVVSLSALGDEIST